LVKPGEGGILLDSTSCGAVLQVPTHFFVASPTNVAEIFESEMLSKETSIMINTVIFFIEFLLFIVA
jgi:hypothetical protein